MSAVYEQALADIRALTPAHVRWAGYVPPAQRPAAWAELAAELAERGLSVGQIAIQLCVTGETVEALLGGAVRGEAA